MKITELVGGKSQLGQLPGYNRDTVWTWRETLENHGFHALGAGVFGTAFAHPKLSYILKVFNPKDTAYVHWLKYCLVNQSNPHVPKFRGKLVKLNGAMAVRMERLTHNYKLGDAVGELASLTQEEILHPDFVTGRLSREAASIAEKWPKLKSVIGDAVHIATRSGVMFDLHVENVMFRGSCPVITDPIATMLHDMFHDDNDVLSPF